MKNAIPLCFRYLSLSIVTFWYSVVAGGAEIRDFEQALLAGQWDVTTEVGQRAWGNIIFRAGHEFSTMNGPQGAWKISNERTVELGDKYQLHFAPALESFVVTGANGAKIATGTRKVAVPKAPSASVSPPVAQPLSDPLNLGRPASVSDQPLKITLPPQSANVSPPVKVSTPAPPVRAEGTATKKKVPVGVPADAMLFHGKWYRVYLERCNWERARERCGILGGRLVVVPDASTWEFLKPMTKGLNLWLGASDEETEGLWKWIDGTPMTFKAWHRHEPNNRWGKQHHLRTVDFGWDDVNKADKLVGFMCEWKDR